MKILLVSLLFLDFIAGGLFAQTDKPVANTTALQSELHNLDATALTRATTVNVRVGVTRSPPRYAALREEG